MKYAGFWLVNTITPALQPVANVFSAHERKSIADWAINKRTIVIASGLNKNITKIPRALWYKLEETSNHVEQTGKKSYSYGKRLHLLPAIIM